MTRTTSVRIACALAAIGIMTAAQGASAPAPRPRAEVEAVLAQAPDASVPEELRELDVVLVADEKDHGENEHDYPLWQTRWRALLGSAPHVRVTTAWKWPSPAQFESADLIVRFCWGHYDDERLDELGAYLERGGGYVSVHPAVITDKAHSARVAASLGLAFEEGYSLWRHGALTLELPNRDHPICMGLPPAIELVDEAYWHFRGDEGDVTVLATSTEAVEKGSKETRPEPMVWTHEPGSGRVFTCILGHNTWTFDDAHFRILLLRGMAWAAGESPYRFDSLVLEGEKLFEE